MKLQNVLRFLVLLNLLSIGLLVASSGNLWFLTGLFLNLPLVGRGRGARYLMIILSNLGLLAVLIALGYYLSGVDGVDHSVSKTGALAIAGLYLAYSMFTLSSKAVKAAYVKARPIDPYAVEGWTCPKCSSHMKFSVACWNCGVKKEEKKATNG